MSFGMIMWKQNMEKKQNYVTWIQTILLSLDDTFKEIADVETRFDTSNIN